MSLTSISSIGIRSTMVRQEEGLMSGDIDELAQPGGDTAGARRSEGRNRDHPAAHSSGLLGLALGALGVVFGDIGTSPLYALQTVFAIDNGAIKPTIEDVYSVVSAIFWSITLVVSVKYVVFILRADNDGEGGIMALAALVRGVSGATARRPSRSAWACSGRRCSTGTR
jgi:KUP system potassium uptake protein